MKKFIAVLMSALLILSFAACKKKTVKKDDAKADSPAFADSSESSVKQDSPSDGGQNTDSELKDGIDALNSAEITVEKNSETADSKNVSDSERAQQESSSASESSQSKDSEPSNDDGYYKGYY